MEPYRTTADKDPVVAVQKEKTYRLRWYAAIVITAIVVGPLTFAETKRPKVTEVKTPTPVNSACWEHVMVDPAGKGCDTSDEYARCENGGRVVTTTSYSGCGDTTRTDYCVCHAKEDGGL